MSTTRFESCEFDIYVCPVCKGGLEHNEGFLLCPACRVSYPISDGIPDFIAGDPVKRDMPIMRLSKPLDWLARIYETPVWYTPVLKIYGGRSAPTFPELIRIMLGLMPIEKGLILDAACGPATWGRRLASPERAVYSVDISWGMLRRGAAYVRQDHVPNMHFARSLVEAIPFPDAHFDAGICGGALHLFPDTVAALCEIGRTLKPGAPLVVMTFTAGEQGVLRSPRVRERAGRSRSLHVFELPMLEKHLAAAGFEQFKPQVYGSLLVFTARRR